MFVSSRSVFIAIVAVTVAVLVAFNEQLFGEKKVPILEDKWWGKGAPTKEVPKIIKTQIDVPEDVIRDLKYRLDNTKPFHPSLEGVNQRYGVHTTILNEVLYYWKNKYNWTKRQQYLNQYPHYFVNIRGLKIHFMHIKPKRTTKKNGEQVSVLPLLMVHGWPGSFREFFEIIPMLTEPREDEEFVFELIIPSLPGFTLSEASPRPGLSAIYMAQILADLMDLLKFKRYFLQGGDWGNNIVQHMAVYYSERIIGVHSNMCFVNTLSSNFKLFIGKYIPRLIYEPEEETLYNSTANSISFIIEETGYFHIQATKPDTVGVGLRDSPMGLAAYILEKFSTLTNVTYRDREDGGLTEKFTMDQLLDNIMLYWTTGSITSAMRIYAEAFTNSNLELKRFPIKIPSGCARFPNEILLSPRSILKEKHRNLVHLSTFQNGGHFAALEQPQLLAMDVYTFVKTVLRL